MRASHHGFVVVLPGVAGAVLLCGGSVCEHLPLLALNRAAGRMVCSVSPRQAGAATNATELELGYLLNDWAPAM